MRRFLMASIATLSLVLSFHAQPTLAAGIDDAALADTSRTEDWLAYGRTHWERRFSPLTDINTGNVDRLGVSWFVNLPEDVGLVATPLVVDGRLFFTGTGNVIRAVDAKTGKPLWTYDPRVGDAIAGRRQVGWSHNRGLSFYDDRLFATTWDGRLLALNPKDGSLIWSTRTFAEDQPLYITGAPKAFAGKVLVGNGGTENGPSRGFVTAYDADTGKQAWRFWIVPGNPDDGFENDAMRMAAKTWTGKWWEHGGGGNAWHGFTYDPEFDVVYIGTGNGSPWNRDVRSPEGGDNLFLCSVVALDASTGEYRWHYQTTPGETWDYNSNMDIVLTDLNIDGREVKALLHAPKNGFFYVINRETGKLISAEPFAETTWASHIDPESGRPVELPNARYDKGPIFITPSPWGAHGWHAMSFNQNTGLAYIPTQHYGSVFDGTAYDANWRAVPFTGGLAVDFNDDTARLRTKKGSLIAWDPVEQRAVWEVAQSDFWNAGTLTTAGNLVFQGRSDGHLYAYDARTGKTLWQADLGLGISAPPITYKLGGVQYVALLVGFGGGVAGQLTDYQADLGWSYGIHMRRLVSFALDADTKLPRQPPPHTVTPLVERGFEINSTAAARGQTVWNENGCGNCHGKNVVAAGMAPDLRASAVPLSPEAFTSVVRDGVRTARMMPGNPLLSDSHLEDLMHFIRQQAHSGRVGL